MQRQRRLQQPTWHAGPPQIDNELAALFRKGSERGAADKNFYPRILDFGQTFYEDANVMRYSTLPQSLNDATSGSTRKLYNLSE